MCLNDLRRGQTATVTDIPAGSLRDQLLRFGLAPGAKVRCHARIPFGPVVLRFGGQEIALGREIARSVAVRGEC